MSLRVKNNTIIMKIIFKPFISVLWKGNCVVSLIIMIGGWGSVNYLKEYLSRVKFGTDR